MSKTHRRDNSERIQARQDRAYLENARRRYTGIAVEQITDLVNLDRATKARRAARWRFARRILAALAVLAIAVAILIALTGCVPVNETNPARGITGVAVGYVTLPDGREVLCVSNHEGYAGGLSCDWDNAR